MMPITGLELEIPLEELTVFDNGRYEEIVQILSDLGYLSISDKENKIVEKIDLFNAVSTFRSEAIQANLLESYSHYSFPNDPVQTPAGIISPQELNLLQLLVGLDGDFTLKELPNSSTLQVYVRVLHYRLHLFGLYINLVGDCYSLVSANAWNTFVNWLSPLDELAVLDLSGHLDKLISHLRQSPKFKNTILYFKYSAAGLASYNISNQGSGSAFKNRLKSCIENSSKEYTEFKKNVDIKQPKRDFLETHCNTDLNRFMLRLMQLYQWTSGYYLGTIDGEIGKVSFSSFLDLAKGEVENGNIGFQLPLLVAHVVDDYWILNSHYFFDSINHGREDSAGIADLFHEFNAHYENLPEELQQNVDNNLKLAWREVNVTKNQDFKSIQFRFRRIYFGIKSMVRSLFRNLKRLFKWLIGKTADFINSIVSLIKNFAKLLFKEIREGLQLFARGMAFIFGKRQIESGNIITHYDFDIDNITVIPDQLTPEQVQTHINLLLDTSKGLDFTLTFTGRLIRFILLTAGIGWRRFLIEIGVVFKEMIKNRNTLLQQFG